jgi:hypothetical protein
MSLYRPIIRVNGGSNRFLAEKGIVEYVMMMKDCKEDWLHAVIEFAFVEFEKH